MTDLRFSGSDGGSVVVTVNAAPARTLTPADNVAAAVAAAKPGDVLLLSPGTYPYLFIDGAAKTGMVTLRGQAGVKVSGIRFRDSAFIRIESVEVNGGARGVELTRANHDLQFSGVKLLGQTDCGFYSNTWDSGVYSLLLEGCVIGDQPAGSGATGVTFQGGVTHHVEIRGTTFRNIANDVFEMPGVTSAGPNHDFVVDRCQFLGVSGRTAGAHTDGWHFYGIDATTPQGYNLTFTNNRVIDAGLSDTLLFHDSRIANVVVDNNLFVNDTVGGYSTIIGPCDGLRYTNNTIVAAPPRWGVLFGQQAGAQVGRGYVVTNNIFACPETIYLEAGVAGWGVFDYNVAKAGGLYPAGGAHSVNGWVPQWVNTTDYEPLGLPFRAGYRKP